MSTCSSGRPLSSLERGQGQQVVDCVGHPLYLELHPARETGHHLRLGVRGQRVRQQAQSSDRGLELVADVGHEVPSHGLDAVVLGDVVHQRDRAQHLTLALDGTGRHLVAAAGLDVQLDPGGDPLTEPGLLEQILDHPGHESLAVAGLQELRRCGVLCDHPTVAVAQHEPGRQRVQARLHPPGFGLS